MLLMCNRYIDLTILVFLTINKCLIFGG